MKPQTPERIDPLAQDDQFAPSVAGALSSLALAILIASLGVSIANVALPTIAQSFSASFQDVQWVLIAYLLAITVLIVSVGRLGDLIGHRRLLLGGIFLFTVSSVLCGLTSVLWGLIAARALQGIGAAVLMAMAIALVRDAVPKKKMGRAMGVMGTMSAIGTALGPTLGGALLSGFGWQAVFLALVPLGALNFFLAQYFIPVGQRKQKTGDLKFDLAGSIVLSLTLAAYAFSMTNGWEPMERDVSGVLLALAVFGVGLFVYIELRTASPLLQLLEFRKPLLTASLITNGLVSTVIMATLVVGPFYLSIGLGLNAFTVGLVMSVGPVVSALSGVPSGVVVDRLGPPLVVGVGLAIMAGGSLALALLPNMFGVLGYIMAMTLLTPGYALFQAANNTAVMVGADTSRRGVISGLLGLSRNLGLITGAAVMGAIFSATSGGSLLTLGATDNIGNGLQSTFLIATALGLLALLIAVSSHVFFSGAAPSAKQGH